MKGLKVEHWHQWETLCCYMISDFVKNKTGHSIQYRSYGSRGQSQFGIDLVPANSQISIVGQCKLKDETSFTWNMLREELEKTDNYANKISCYLLFTTANRHTSIQDIENGSPDGRITHTRENGKKFPVFIIYWSEIQDLSFIPQNVMRQVFPKAFEIAAPPQPLPIDRNYLESLANLRQQIPRWINNHNITWLESWNFSLFYIIEDDIAPFEDLFFEMDRTITNLRNNFYENLAEGQRAQIAICFPAGQRLFEALSALYKTVHAHGQGNNLPDGTGIISLEGLEGNMTKIAHDWQSKARYLAETYRKDILGETR